MEEHYGEAKIADAREILRALREEIGETVFVEWAKRTYVLVSEKTLLLCGLLEQGVWRGENEITCSIAKGEPPESSKCNAKCSMRYLWENWIHRGSSQRQKSNEQLTGQLSAFVQELSRQTAQAEIFMRCLRSSCKGEPSLQQALASMEKEQQKRVGYGIYGHDSVEVEGTGGISSLRGSYNQAVYDARGNGGGEIVPTITGDHQNRVTDYTAICVGNGQLHNISMAEQANTLDTMHDQQAVLVPEIAHALKAKANLQFRVDSETYPMDAAGVVRRLTPLENERLQGMPDDWSKYGINEKGEVYELSDTARYVLQGNGIARPFWTWLLRRIAAQYERPATLGSLFSGQSSFELSWQEVGGIPVWCSEIEKNAVAVSKYHFPDEGSD